MLAQQWWSDIFLLYTHKLPSRVYNLRVWIESQAGGTCSSYGENRTSSGSYSRIVSYCSIGIYVLNAAFRPILGPTSPPILDVHCAISGEIVERTTIKLYRISESPFVLAILELSVIDGPWRTYRLLTRSQNYSDSMLLRVTDKMKAANKMFAIRFASKFGKIFFIQEIDELFKTKLCLFQRRNMQSFSQKNKHVY